MSKTSGELRESSTYSAVVAMLGDVTEEWDLGTVEADTVLGTIGLESINLVYLIAELQQKFGLEDRLFKKLMAENSNIMELRVIDIVRMIQELGG